MFRHVISKVYQEQFRKALRYNSTETSAAANAPVSPPPVEKVPLLKKWKNFWIALYSDYREVSLDTIRDIKAKPKKAAAYFTCIGMAWYAINTNPDAKSYYETLLETTDDVIMVSKANLNPVAEERLKLIRQAYNEGTIRHMSLGLFSIIWLGNFHPDCAVYPSQCSYLKPGIINFHKRVVDIGFVGHWWNIKRYMIDYDINPDEFPPNQGFMSYILPSK